MSYSTIKPKPPLQRHINPPATPYAVRNFDFSGVVGLSTHALDVHRSLYEGYVKECNALLPIIYGTREAMSDSPLERLKHDGLVRRYAFERNGMVLHELFFEALCGRSDPPRATGVFREAVEENYGGFDGWQADVFQLAQTRGVGWVLVVQSASDTQLTNIWVDDHTRGIPADCHIVLAIDLWEHAYLLDFKPADRLKYVQTVFDNIDWEVIEARCF